MDDTNDSEDDALVFPFRDKLAGYQPIHPLDVVREKQKGWENPNVCEHGKFLVSRSLRTVECGLCGALVDPIEALFLVARAFGQVEWKLQVIRDNREREKKSAGRAAEKRAKKQSPA